MLSPLPRRGRLGALLADSPSRISLPRYGLSGRPAHQPFRGLLGVHSRYGLHTRAVTVFDTLTERLQPFRFLHGCSGCFRLERLPGGSYTHWKAPSTAHTQSGCSPPSIAALRRPFALDVGGLGARFADRALRNAHSDLLRFDVSRPNDFAPFLGFLANEFAEVGWRHWRGGTPSSARRALIIGSARAGLFLC